MDVSRGTPVMLFIPTADRRKRALVTGRNSRTQKDVRVRRGSASSIGEAADDGGRHCLTGTAVANDRLCKDKPIRIAGYKPIRIAARWTTVRIVGVVIVESVRIVVVIVNIGIVRVVIAPLDGIVVILGRRVFSRGWGC